jgi:hypothetical protein
LRDLEAEVAAAKRDLRRLAGGEFGLAEAMEEISALRQDVGAATKSRNMSAREVSPLLPIWARLQLVASPRCCGAAEGGRPCLLSCLIFVRDLRSFRI